MDGAAQMRAECAGLHRTADNARRVHNLGTATQKVLGASMHRATQGNRSCAIPAQAHTECAGRHGASRKRASSAALSEGDRMQPIPHQRRTAQRPPLKGSRTASK